MTVQLRHPPHNLRSSTNGWRRGGDAVTQMQTLTLGPTGVCKWTQIHWCIHTHSFTHRRRDVLHAKVLLYQGPHIAVAL